MGGGCVAAAGPTQCMCRHLTDFASARVPKIQTCSLSDMMSLSPGDIITKLRFLFIVVIGLFGFMNVGAVIAFFLDASERKHTLARLLCEDTGFREQPDGAWTWRIEQAPMRSAVEAPRGSAMTLAGIFGLPFVRLRAAVPEDLFAGGVGQALGRQAGLSVTGLEDSRDENFDVMQQLAQALSCCAAPAPKIPQFDEEAPRSSGKAKYKEGCTDEVSAAAGSSAHSPASGRPTRDMATPLAPSSGVRTFSTSRSMRGSAPVAAPSKHAASRPIRGSTPVAAPTAQSTMSRLAEMTIDDLTGASDKQAAELVGTALVFAFMANAKTLPVVQLAERQAAASAHFRGLVLRSIDHGFDELMGMFTVMLSSGNLSGRSDWLTKSRMWRCIFLQRGDGGWDMSESLAFAMQAHEGARPPPRPPQSKLRTLLGVLLGDEDLGDALDDVVDDAMSSDSDVEEAEDAVVDAEPKGPSHVIDCPLTFSRRALRKRLPKALMALNDDFYAAEEERAAARARAALPRSNPLSDAWVATSQRVAEETAAVAAAVAMQHSAVAQLGVSMRMFFDDALSAFVPRPPAAEETMREPSPPPRAPPVRTPTAETTSRSLGTAAGGRRKRHARRRVPVERIWATVLALSILEEMDSCWLLDPEAADEGTPWRTIVDGGREYLAEQCAADRRLRKLLKTGAMEEAADRARKDWAAIQAENVARLRDTDVINKFTLLTHVQRGSARIVRSMMTDHSAHARVDLCALGSVALTHRASPLRRHLRHVPGHGRLHHALAALQCVPCRCS